MTGGALEPVKQDLCKKMPEAVRANAAVYVHLEVTTLTEGVCAHFSNFPPAECLSALAGLDGDTGSHLTHTFFPMRRFNISPPSTLLFTELFV